MSKYPVEGYVYFLRAKDNLYKIGRSVEIDARLKQIQPKYPYDLTFEKIVFSLDMAADERMFHEKFKNKRLRGEWFELSEDDLDLDCDNPTMTYEEYLEGKNFMSIGYEKDYLYRSLLSRMGDIDDAEEDEIRALISRLVAIEVLREEQTKGIFGEMTSADG